MHKSIFEKVYDGSVNETMATKVAKELEKYKGDNYWEDVIANYDDMIDHKKTESHSRHGYDTVFFKDRSVLDWDDREGWRTSRRS